MSFLLLFLLCFSSLSYAESSPIGSVISSHTQEYLVVNSLGKGVYGKVFSVKDTNGSYFALKSYYDWNDFRGTHDIYGKVEREYWIGQNFDHPHIIKSIETFDNCVILELVDGSTLADLARNSLSEDEAVVACLQVIDALLYASAQEYYYLDLNSRNVMFDRNKNIKIIDIGSFVSVDEIKFHRFASKINQIVVGNFEKIVTICDEIFDRSTLSKAERLERREALKKLGQKGDCSIQEYLILLRDLISTFGSCFSSQVAIGTHP